MNYEHYVYKVYRDKEQIKIMHATFWNAIDYNLNMMITLTTVHIRHYKMFINVLHVL
jgi:hypothetical protein